MDDKFLYQLQEQPDPEFVRNLYRKLDHAYDEPGRRTNMFLATLLKSRPLVWIGALVAIIIFAALATSPGRAFVSSLLVKVGGQAFEVTEDYPGDNDPGEEKIIEPQILPLGEALAMFPHDITLPANIPPEYVLNEDAVRVYVGVDAGPFANTIEIEWRSDDHRRVNLMITDIDSGVFEIVAPESMEEVLLDANHSAVLIRGGWDADQKAWRNEYGVRLRWVMNDLTYALMGLNQAQLIEIAISTLK